MSSKTTPTISVPEGLTSEGYYKIYKELTPLERIQTCWEIFFLRSPETMAVRTKQKSGLINIKGLAPFLHPVLASAGVEYIHIKQIVQKKEKETETYNCQIVT